MQSYHPGGLELTKECCQKITITSNSNILDIGCGTGTTLSYLKDTYHCQIHGVDLSVQCVNTANQLLAYNNLLPVLVGDACQLPFPDQSFDYIFMECVLTLLDTPKLALSEIYRLLKPGGSLIMTNLTSLSTTHQSGTIQYQKCLSLLDEVGFKNIKTIDYSQHLIQFIVDAIFTYGSLANYIEEASKSLGGSLLNCHMSSKSTKYYLYMATK